MHQKKTKYAKKRHIHHWLNMVLFKRIHLLWGKGILNSFLENAYRAIPSSPCTRLLRKHIHVLVIALVNLIKMDSIKKVPLIL